MTDTVLRLADVKTRTGRGRSSILADIKAGAFPAPFKIDGRSNAWLESDINNWLEQRIESTRAIAPAKARSIAATETARRLTIANTAMNDSIHEILVPEIVAARSSQPMGMVFRHYADCTAKAVMPDLKTSSADAIALRSEREQAMLAIVRHGVRQRLEGWMEQAKAAEVVKPYKAVYQKAKAWAIQEAEQLRALSEPEITARLAADVPLLEGASDE